MTETTLDAPGESDLIQVPTSRIESCGDISCEFLIDPIPRPKPPPFAVQMKPAVPEVIFVDSSKPNSMQILEAARDILKARGVRVRETILKKWNSSQSGPESIIGQLKSERGMLLLGVND